jgi:hypothetical protein
VSVVYEAVEDAVGDSDITDLLVPPRQEPARVRMVERV